MVLIFPHKKIILYLDPLGKPDEKKYNFFQSWNPFINGRFSAGLESSGPSKRKAENVKHSKLLDSVSHGVNVMKVGRTFIQWQFLIMLCATTK